jgi:hypothetical protein
MSRSTRSARPLARPSAALVVAGLALLVAMGGTGYASGLVTGKQVKNSSLTGKDIRDATVSSADVVGLTKADIAADALDGDVIDELRLETVGSAHDAANAHELDGMTNADFLHTAGCQIGKVLGFAHIRGDDGTMPATYTAGLSHVSATHNCSGAQVQVRRIAVGQYRVKFLGNPAYLAFAQVRTEHDSTDADLCLGLRKETAAGVDLNAFAVTVTTCDGTSTPRDADFSLILP